MNDLEFFDLGIYEFEQQLINCVGITVPLRMSLLRRLFRLSNDKPPFCSIKRKIIVLLHLPCPPLIFCNHYIEEGQLKSNVRIKF